MEPDPKGEERAGEGAQAAEAATFAALRALVARLDAPPEHVLAGARMAFTWRTVDAELAELIRDTAADTEAGEPVAVRGAAEGRLLSFEAGGLAIELEAVPAGDGTHHLTGQILPPGTGAVVLERLGGAVEMAADVLGRFRAAGVTPGHARLRVRPVASPADVVTPWFTV